MEKNILLPTDFSINSVNAINYAVKLFENITCNFYVLNVQRVSSFISDDMMTVSSSTTIYNTLIDTAKKSITNIISEIEAQYKNKNHTFFSIVDYDNFIDAINQVTDKYDIDLIVMGTKGASGIEKVLFGSNTIHVINRCNTPVIVVPKGCEFKALNSVAFTSSLSSTYHMDNLKPLKDLVSLYKSKLKVLHVIEDDNFEEMLSQNIDFFDSNFPQVIYHRMDSGGKDIYNSIHDYAVADDIKMIAMVSKKHSFFNRLFNKHAVETFAYNIDMPLLVLKDFD